MNEAVELAHRYGSEASPAFINGVLATDTPVIDIGMVDTPQIYFAVNHMPCCGGVQTTALRVINTIPEVCAHASGLISTLDLPYTPSTHVRGD